MMSNRADLSKIKLEYVKDNITECGYKLFDDYYTTVETFLFKDEKIPDDDLEFLEFVCEEAFDKCARELLEFLYENEKGLTINSTSYEFDQIKDILSRALFKKQ